jgi:hypothetical protein
MSGLSLAMTSVGDGDITGCWGVVGDGEGSLAAWRTQRRSRYYGVFWGSIGDGEGSLASPSTTNHPSRTHRWSKTANPAEHTWQQHNGSHPRSRSDSDEREERVQTAPSRARARWRVRRFLSREACECRSDNTLPLSTTPCEIWEILIVGAGVEEEAKERGWDRLQSYDSTCLYSRFIYAVCCTSNNCQLLLYVFVRPQPINSRPINVL